jgi:hypothetical protein
MTNIQINPYSKQDKLERELKWVKTLARLPKTRDKQKLYTDTNINLSGVGNLQKISSDEIYTFKHIKGGKGKVYPTREAKCISNLKKGGREELKRHTLTSYAKEQIRNAGSVLSWKVNNDYAFNSTIMITLTYGKNVPDHKTAKKHLDLLLQNCRNNNWLRYYVWVAQLQTGKRAKEKGLKSYRAENGNAIHFHILTITEKGNKFQYTNAQKLLRSYWKNIVNKWEIKQGYKPQNIGGVDVTAVYNSANYISRYITNEEETIIGNMWNMSSKLRKAIEPTIEHFMVNTDDFNSIAKDVFIKKQFRVNAEGKKEKVKEASNKTISFENWDKSFVICTDDINSLKNELDRRKRNRNKLKKYGNKEMSELQY